MPRWFASPAARISSAREPALARLRDEPLAAGQPEPELLRDLVAEPAAGEVLAHRGAGLGLPQRALEVRGRLLEQRGQPLAAPSRGVGPRRALLVLEGDPEPVGEPLDRLGEVEILRLLDEADDVAALPAAEAVVELVDGIDGEARRPFLVEGAAPREARARRSP